MDKEQILELLKDDEIKKAVRELLCISGAATILEIIDSPKKLIKSDESRNRLQEQS